MRHYSVEIVQDIPSGDPQGLDSMLREQSIATGVSFRALFKAMRFAIDFDAQPRFGAVEIKNVGSCGMLAPKLESVRTRPKVLPQCDFGEREGSAKPACSSDGLAWFAQHGACPPTMFHMVPLPKTSLGRICRL